jgi:hypothetical protein
VGESKQVERPVSEQKAIEGLFGVEQVLNWKTAAVKRLDDLQLMYMSSRTVRELKPPRFIAAAAAAEGADAAAAGGDTGATGAVTSASGAGGVPQPGGGLQGSTQTKNGLETSRYTDVGEQVRHMPVAMVVVVDEEHLPELLAAFVNSKLRIQVNQVHWQHCREPMNPNQNEGQFTPSAPTAPVAGPRTMGPGGPTSGSTMIAGQKVPYGANNPALSRGERDRGRMPGPGGPQPLPRGAMGGPVGGRPTPGAGPGMNVMRGPGASLTPTEGEEQEDLNLLEVAVYGLASLYERYPPAPKPAEGASSTPDDKQPAAGATGGK